MKVMNRHKTAKRKREDPHSVYRSVKFRVVLEGYGSRNEHKRELNHLIQKNWPSGSKVL